MKVGQRSKSYGYIMYSGKICYNSITGGNGVIRAYKLHNRGLTLGRPPLQVGHKTVAMASNTGFLATGRLNLHYMIEYIKNAKANKLQNRRISSRCGPGHMTQFGESRSYGYIMYSGTMCYNSITGGHIFVLRG